MKINGGAIEFFNTIPDDVLIQIAEKDWDSLVSLCMALALDIQLLEEEAEYFRQRFKKRVES